MGKDSYYFSHDSNARNDIKIIRLRRALGMEGYGIYFALIEILREQEDFKLPMEALTDIAFDLHTSEEKVKTVVGAYELFLVEDERFFSARLIRSMSDLNAKRQKYIDAGRKGGEASVKHRLSDGQALNKSKLKEIYKNYLFFDEEFLITWNKYLSMRVKIKKPATEDAEILGLNKLSKLSNNKKSLAIEIVEQSIMNSWQGIFELKEDLFKQQKLEQNTNQIHAGAQINHSSLKPIERT